MTITSKYSAKCKKCGGFISVGEKIEWSKEEGPRHVVCRPPEKSAVLTAPQRPIGGPKNQKPFEPGAQPYRGKFPLVEQAYRQAERSVGARHAAPPARFLANGVPRTTTTFHGKYTTTTA